MPDEVWPPYSLAIDDSGDVYVAGYTESTDFPVTGEAFQSEYDGGGDAFVTKFDPTLSVGETLPSVLNEDSFTGGMDYDSNHLELAFTRPQDLSQPVDLYISLTQPAAEGGRVTYYFGHAEGRITLSNGIYFNNTAPTTEKVPYCTNCTMPDTLQLYGLASMNPIFNDGWVIPHPFTMADGVESCQYLPDGDYTFTVKAYEPGTNNLLISWPQAPLPLP